MCELKYTYICCAREDCGRCEYLTETIYRCPPMKAHNCNGLKQMTPERSEVEVSCSIHFYEQDEEGEYGPNTEYTEISTEIIDEILSVLSQHIIMSRVRPEDIQPKLHMLKSFTEWCGMLDQDLETDGYPEVPDLTDSDTESDDSVVSDDEYASFNASQARPMMRRRGSSSFASFQAQHSPTG